MLYTTLYYFSERKGDKIDLEDYGREGERMMIAIWNRKELLSTFSMKQQSDTRDMLTVNHIDYVCKVIDRNSPAAMGDMRARTGTLGQNLDIAKNYIIYVHKAEFEKAKELLQRMS